MKILIKHKLLIGISFLFLILSFFNLYAVKRIRFFHQTADQIIQHPLAITRLTLEAMTEINAMHRTMKDIVLADNEQERAEYLRLVNDSDKKVDEDLEEISLRILGSDGKVLAEKATENLVLWRPIRSRVIELINEGRLDDAESITKKEGAMQVGILYKGLKAIEMYASEKAKNFHSEVERASKNSAAIILTSFLITIILGAGLVIILTVSLTHRIAVMSDAAEKMRSGDFSEEIHVQGSDELDELAKSFNFMSRELKALYSSLEAQVEERTSELKKTKDELEEKYKDLEKNKEDLLKVQAELETKVNDLQALQQATFDREHAIIRLKKEVNSLAKKLGQKEPYDLSFLDQDEES